LDSSISQTYKNTEILLIDDGSTDDSSKIASEFSRTHSNCYLERTENKGPGNARNIGLSMSKGELIVFIDSDDHMEPFMVQKMVKALVGSRATIVLCGFRLFNKEKSEISSKAWGCKEHIISGKRAIEAMYTGKIPVTVWAKIFRRDCLEDLKFPTGMIYEDRPFMLAAFSQSEEVHYLDEVLLNVQKRAYSLTRSPLSDKKIKDLTDIYLLETSLALRLQLKSVIPFIRLYHLSWLRRSFFTLQKQEKKIPATTSIRPVLLDHINQFSCENFSKLPIKAKFLLCVLRLPKRIGWKNTRKLMNMLYPAQSL